MVPLTAPERLLDPPFNVKLSTVIYAFGYNGSINDNTTLPVINAYLEYKQRYDLNVVLMNWEREARIVVPLNLIGAAIQYPTTAILNTRTVGGELGAALVRLSELGLDLDKVHLSGHSLGAHLMGYAGKVTRSSGKIIPRITGLDPAGPLFEGPVSLVGLQPGDARFVDVIHTNPIFLGDPDRLGDVDIRFNCDMLHQPGCPRNYIESCSHFRAPLYFAESINSPRGFTTVQARTCLDWRSGRNNRDGRILYWGENIDTQARGTYYIRTNRSPPFERGLNGIRP
ncbi:unnamed protein product [Pieris macdunnoughi]|nr:unnamed protein product [Pieris macdunnoughi]